MILLGTLSKAETATICLAGLHVAGIDLWSAR